MNIDNLTLEQKKEIAQLICSEEYGFEGRQTFPQCEECIVCLCRKDTKYDEYTDTFDGDEDGKD